MRKVVWAVLLAAVSCFIFAGFTRTDAHVVTFSEKFGGSSAEGESGVYNFDPYHTSIGFTVVHMGLINVPGYFREFTGSVNYDAADVTRSTVEFSAKTASVDTRVEQRDNHLRTADFFDVEKYPDMTFKSAKVAKNGDVLEVTGDLTLRGVTKSITLPVRIVGFIDGNGGKVMGATVETSIDRSDFGVNYGLDGVISKDVRIILNIEARQQVKKE
jgi:polyisoprenoid-binding protein YceI